jgi:hypothetical protein
MCVEIATFTFTQSRNKSTQSLTLFPQTDVLSQEIESWRGFAECLPPSDQGVFLKMLHKLYDYSTAINANSEPFPSEAILLALVFEQHELIQWLKL